MRKLASNTSVTCGNTMVLASAATGLADFIDRMGGDSLTIMRDVGLPDSLATRPNSFIYLGDYCRALGRAAEVTGKKNFGLWFGQQFTPRSLGLLGYLASSSATLGDALKNITAYFPFYQSNSSFELEIQGRLSVLKYKVNENMDDDRHDAELSLTMFFNLIREALGRQWSPLHVWFSHGRPGSGTEHQSVFGAEVIFDQPCNALVFSSSDLDSPMPFADSMLASIMKQSLEQVADQRSMFPMTVADQVAVEIKQLLSQGYPKLTDVAERLRIPSWTLQRRLAEEGKSFSDIVEKVRAVIARELLEAPNYSISDVAYLLGYSDLSAFSRAFSRWYHMSPRRWRDCSEAQRKIVNSEVAIASHARAH